MPPGTATHDRGRPSPDRDLTKKKNDEMHEESWVECSICERWVHQICALFNGRKNKVSETVYHCPFCILEVSRRCFF